MLTSTIALVLSLSFLLFKQIIKDEGGNYGIITGYRAGYWLWVGTMVAVFIGNLMML